MKMVFQQKVQEKESKLKQSEEELYARHREMKEALEKQRLELEDKRRRLESGRPLTPEKGTVSFESFCLVERTKLIRVAEEEVRDWEVAMACLALFYGYLIMCLTGLDALCRTRVPVV